MLLAAATFVGLIIGAAAGASTVYVLSRRAFSRANQAWAHAVGRELVGAGINPKLVNRAFSKLARA